MAPVLLVVNMRGTVNVPTPVKRTLQQLKILRRYSATLVPDSESYLGMLRSASPYLSWSKIDQDFIIKLIESRGRKVGWKAIEKSDFKSFGYRGIRTLAKDLAQGKVKLSDMKGLKPFFRLNPPKGGFKHSTRRMFRDHGILGENPDLPKIVERML